MAATITKATTTISLALALGACALAFKIGTTYQRLTTVETQGKNHAEIIKSLADIAADNKRRLDLLEATK